MTSRTMINVKRLEAQRADALKRIAKDGDPLGKEAEALKALDQAIAGAMGITVDQLAGMRK